MPNLKNQNTNIENQPVNEVEAANGNGNQPAINVQPGNVNNVSTFEDIQSESILNNLDTVKKREDFIRYFEGQHKMAFDKYDKDIKKREKTLGHSIDEIRALRNELIAKHIFLDDYYRFLTGKKYVADKAEKMTEKDKRFLDELKKRTAAESNPPIDLNDKNAILKKAGRSIDRYYDYIAYKLGKEPAHVENAQPWTEEEIKNLTKCDLKTWTIQQLRDLWGNGLPRIPKRKVKYSVIETAFRSSELDTYIKDFDDLTAKLAATKAEASSFILEENNFLNLSDENREKAKKQLQDFIEKVSELEEKRNSLTIDGKTKNSREMYNFLKEYTKPDSKSGMSKTDAILDSYISFTLSFNQVSPGFERINIADSQKDTINTIQHFSRTIAELNESFESRFEGNLHVPNPGTKEENGKKIHWINAKGFEPKSGDKKFDIEFVDKSNEPLFKSDPSPDDVRQGSLGDCYMLASLSAIADQNPDTIKDMMKDNGDTVTVRFFNDDNEPVYVTVDKSVPVKKGDTDDVYAEGSLWVQLLEKAYVCSGLHKGKTKDAEKGNFNKIDYMDIDGGHETDFIRRVFGKNKSFDFTISEELFIDGYSPIDGKAAMNNDAQLLLDYFNKGMIITTSALSDKENDRGLYNGLTYKDADIIGEHAYSVTNIEKENDEYYVTIRNPHASRGADVDDMGILHYRDGNEARGYTRMKYRTFCNFFAKVEVNKYDFTLEEQKRLPEARKLVNTYGYAVEKIAKILDDNDNPFLEVFKNSDEFNKFHSATNGLLKEMKMTAPNPTIIKNHLESFFETAKDYRNYCDITKHIDAKTEKGRTLARYKMSKIAEKLEEVYNRNIEKASPEAWEEFSYKNVQTSLEMPITPYEMFDIAKLNADRLESIIDTSDDETKRKSYDSVMNFIKNGYETFIPVLNGKMDSDDLMKLYEKNRNNLTIMTMISGDSERLASMMERDGYFVGKEIGKNEFLTLCEKIKPIFEGVKMGTDIKEYKMERTLPDIAGITGTPMDKIRKIGYGYKDIIADLNECINKSRDTLKEFSKGNINSITTDKKQEPKVIEEEIKQGTALSGN